jgi:hypothetical protein
MWFSHVLRRDAGDEPRLFVYDHSPAGHRAHMMNTSRKRVLGPAPKCHLSRFGWPLGTNDTYWSRFIWGYRSRFVAWTGTTASPVWHVPLCGLSVPVHGMNRDQRPSPGYKLIPSPLPFATKICWIVCVVWVLAFFSFDCTQGVRRNVLATFKFAQHGILRWG